MASLFKVKALYDFEAKEDDDLGFPGGQVIDVTEEIDDNWLEGKYTDANGATQSGIFPREFVEKYEPPVPSRPTRPSRPKQEPVPEPPTAATRATQQDQEDDHDTPPVPAASKPQPPPVEESVTASKQEEVRSEPNSVKSPVLPSEPPAAPKPTPAEPASGGAKKPPPPIAAKSNAFRDRIAAFNQPAAAPVAPMVPGGSRSGANTFIKKPFVAPPPMANSYVPPAIKHEPIHKPYIREEDPEIKRRQEEDRAAAEAAGFSAVAEGSGEQQEEGEDAPKPQTLKERIALLQQQQLEQAQRRADGGSKKEKKAPVKQASESSEQGQLQDPDADDETAEHERESVPARQSLDVSRERPRVPSTQRKPSVPLSPVPAAPDSELVSDGNEADQSAAGETTEDDAGTIGPEDSDETSAPLPPQRAAAAPRREPEPAQEDDNTEDAEDDEDSMDEETRKRMEIRARMAKMSGGMGMPGMFGAMPLPGATPVKRSKEKKPSEDAVPTSPPPQQRVPMIPVPGLQRVQSPESEIAQQAPAERSVVTGDDEDDQALPPPRRSTTEDRGLPPPVPKGKVKRRKSLFSMRISRRDSKLLCPQLGHHFRGVLRSSQDGASDEPNQQAAGSMLHASNEHYLSIFLALLVT